MCGKPFEREGGNQDMSSQLNPKRASSFLHRSGFELKRSIQKRREEKPKRHCRPTKTINTPHRKKKKNRRRTELFLLYRKVEKRVAMAVLVFLILLHSTCLLPRGKQKEEEEEKTACGGN